jgi:hypothetical protein
MFSRDTPFQENINDTKDLGDAMFRYVYSENSA